MAVKPSSNNRFGRSLVSDIAGVGTKSNTNTSKRAMTAADIIKKQQQAVQQAEEKANDNEVISENEATKIELPVTETPKTEPTSTGVPIAETQKTAISKDKNAIAEVPVTEIKENTVQDNKATATKQENISKEVAKSEENAENMTPGNEQINTDVTEAKPEKKMEFKENVMENNAENNIKNNSIPTNDVISTTSPQNNTEVNAKMEQQITNFVPQNQTYQQPYMNNNSYGYQQTNLYGQNGYGVPQQNGYNAPQQNGYNAPQQSYYGNYQETYQPVNQQMGYPQDIQNAELHKTTNFAIFEDYPDINVRLPIKTGGDREMLKKSILESGIADPIIVAPVNDVIRAFQAVQFPIPNYASNVQFIIIAGQNRRSIAKELNIELPFIIKRGLTKEQMDAIGLDTNLLNRQFSAMKPSEQVYIVNRRRALFEQNNTRNIRGKLSEITGYEKTYIYQLLSLVNVKRELLTDFVDQGFISVSGITHLVSVPFSNQELLYDYLIRYNIKKLMASQMKALLQDTTTEWTDQYLSQVLFPNTKKLSNITIRPDQYQGIIPEEDLPKATEIILAALREYYKK